MNIIHTMRLFMQRLVHCHGAQYLRGLFTQLTLAIRVSGKLAFFGQIV